MDLMHSIPLPPGGARVPNGWLKDHGVVGGLATLVSHSGRSPADGSPHHLGVTTPPHHRHRLHSVADIPADQKRRIHANTMIRIVTLNGIEHRRSGDPVHRPMSPLAPAANATQIVVNLVNDGDSHNGVRCMCTGVLITHGCSPHMHTGVSIKSVCSCLLGL